MLRSLVVSICATGLVLAQTATTPSTATPAPSTGNLAPGGRGPNGGLGPGRGPGGFGRGPVLEGRNAEARLTKSLSLDATQQNTLHTILQSSQVQRKGLAEKARSLQTQMATAVKAGNESLIESLSKDLASLHEQETTIHAKALASFYGSLNDTQKAKIEPSLNRELGVPGPRGGRGPRGATGAAQPATN